MVLAVTTNSVVLLVCYTKTDREDWVVSLLDCMDYMGCRNAVAEDFRTQTVIVEMVGVGHRDIEAVVVDAIVVFVDRDVAVGGLVGLDWEILDIDATYSVVCFPMAVVRIFDLDQPEEGYYSDS